MVAVLTKRNHVICRWLWHRLVAIRAIAIEILDLFTPLLRREVTNLRATLARMAFDAYRFVPVWIALTP
jgi:hypothetical protein